MQIIPKNITVFILSDFIQRIFSDLDLVYLK